MTNNIYEVLKPTLPKLALTILFVYFFVPIIVIAVVHPTLPPIEAEYDFTLYECNDQIPNCLEAIIGGVASITYPNLMFGIIIGYLFSCILVKIGFWLHTKTPPQ